MNTLVENFAYDDHGNVEQRLSYDAWGNLRNPATWNGSFTGTPMFDRGFTGHEHLLTFDEYKAKKKDLGVSESLKLKSEK